MKDGRLPRIALYVHIFRNKRKAVLSRMGWDEVIRKDLKAIETSLESLKREALKRLG